MEQRLAVYKEKKENRLKLYIFTIVIMTVFATFFLYFMFVPKYDKNIFKRKKYRGWIYNF